MNIFLILFNLAMGVSNLLLANGEYNFSFYVGIFNFCAAAFIWGLILND